MIAILLCLLSLPAAEVYQPLMAEFAKPEAANRLPGSPGFAAAAEALERTLGGAGVRLQRQRFATLAPHTTTCRLTVDGRPLAAVALAPNGIAPPTTWGGVISGRSVYVGRGDPGTLPAVPVADAVAVLDLGAPRSQELFALGARAVVLVADGGESQWSVAGHFTELPIQTPRVVVDRAAAEAAGLLAPGGRQVELELQVEWADAVGENLWALLPADPASPTRGQTIILAATLDTFGITPERNPQLRQAANCALLAQVAADLRGQALKRNILVVFLGSHYGAQDGARRLYWVAAKVMRPSESGERLDERQAGLVEAAAEVDEELALLAGDFLHARGDGAFTLAQHLRTRLVGLVNNLNYEARTVRLAKRAGDKAVSQGRATPAGQQELEQREAAVVERKRRINDLRRQVHEGVISDPATFAEVVAAMRAEALRQQAYIAQETAHLASSRALADALAGSAVVAHLGFDFADARRPWMADPSSARVQCSNSGGSAGLFGKQIRALAQAHATIPPALVVAPLHVPDVSATWASWTANTPRVRPLPIAAAFGLGVFGAHLVTVGDPLAQDELPLRWQGDLAPLAPQLARFAAAVANHPELPTKTQLVPTITYDRRFVRTRSGGRWQGLRVDDWARGSEEITGPSADALVFAQRFSEVQSAADTESWAGVSAIAFGRVDPSGFVDLPRVADDNTAGNVQAVGFDERGCIDRMSVRNESTHLYARLFYTRVGGLFTPLMPKDYLTLLPPTVLESGGDAKVRRQTALISRSGLAFFADQEKPVKVLSGGNMLLGGAQAAGVPFRPDQLLSTDLLRSSAEDLSALNHRRLEVLRSRNLVNRPVEQLQADADDHRERAQAAREAGDQAGAGAHDTAAAVLAARAYVPIRATADDMLRAVVILLLLAIPFAFVCERLLLGSTSIYRQVGGFAGIFCATFAVLYLTHPAFALASAPVVIFLAFVIILLSGFVIAVVMSKFRHELKAMQGLSSRAHSAGGGQSTAFAAVMIGISGMRNRPLKTFLTASTVILLTFTILVFASFEATLGVKSTWLGRARGAERIELHAPSFLRLPDRLLDSVRVLAGEGFEVHLRSASFRDPTAWVNERPLSNVALNPRTLASQALEGVLGIEPGEVLRLGGIYAGLDRTDPAGRPPLLLPVPLAAQLGLVPGDEVRLRGTAFVLAGTFDPRAAQALENIDGSRIAAPNYEATLSAISLDGGGADLKSTLATIDAGAIQWAAPELTAVTTVAALRPLGAQPNLAVLYVRPGADAARTADSLAPLFNYPVFVTGPDGARSLFYTRLIEGSGYLELLVPLLLGGLIIFSSLLGSIVDRQKEIFTFSALGLSPKDVGMLFFAESAVFAVVGGMGGYLVGQVVASALQALAARGLATAPNVNFSSTSALVTILIVMAMVMLSTIYPALMASRSANPGVNRSWRMPRAEGDRLAFTFPFTVPAASVGGILAFIGEHFRNHGDASLDVFSARDTVIEPLPDGRWALAAEVALAPFDLGVVQGFRLATRASDIPGIDEVVVELERRNGTPGSWVRGNRAFIDDLRQQFLVWRSLPVETVHHYQQAMTTPAPAPAAVTETAHGQA
ncbi:MAG: FtsX-like permease family protein [Planctomycetes bacterium]|nr:FtsX-like permease family protein [Planctomycetota bacterium]